MPKIKIHIEHIQNSGRKKNKNQNTQSFDNRKPIQITCYTKINFSENNEDIKQNSNCK